MITLAELQQLSRSRADMEKSQFIKDDELTSYINHSIAELHDILVQSYGSEYNMKVVTFSLATNVESYPLSTVAPANDFYKLYGVDAQIDNTDWYSLTPFNFNERNKFSAGDIGGDLGPANIRYRLSGNNIIFAPTPDRNILCRMWYIPVAAKLVLPTDVLDSLNAYDEYIIVDVAIKMLQKAELDVSVLLNQKAALKQRIEDSSQNRDAGKSESISDIYAEEVKL